MGEQVGIGELTVLGLEALLVNPVVGGLAVLQAFAAGDVREREEEVVDVVVARVVGCAGLADEVGDFVEQLGAEVGVIGLVGDDVDVVLGRDLRSEGELVEVLAGDDGRVFKLLDGGGLELGGAANLGVGIVRAGRA